VITGKLLNDARTSRRWIVKIHIDEARDGRREAGGESTKQDVRGKVRGRDRRWDKQGER
jgi:hypothetical protein